MRITRLCRALLSGAVALIGVLTPQFSRGQQFHGFTIIKSDAPSVAHMGDTIHAMALISNADRNGTNEVGDAIIITNVYNITYNFPGSVPGCPVRVTNVIDLAPYSTTNTVTNSCSGETLTYFGIYLPAQLSNVVLSSEFTVSCDAAAAGYTIPDLFVAEGLDTRNQDINPCPLASANNNAASVRVLVPCISCTKSCTNGVGEDGIITFGGTVMNCGNEPLMNVFVENNQPTNHTPVAFFPVLLPGEATNFSGSYPGDPCSQTTDTITVWGTEQNFGQPTLLSVTNTCSSTCSNILTPAIVVTKNCPPNATQPGTPLVFSGIVSNAGNVTLTNIIVLNDHPSNNTPVFGPITLKPGQIAPFTGSYVVPPDSCGPYSDTLTVQGTSICGILVTNTASATCPGTNSPSIAVTKSCPPTLLQPGQTNMITGTVTNTGNITLTNVTVTNVIPVLGVTRQILGPLTLAPGAGSTFTDSYVIPLDSCGPYQDTVIAGGSDKCFGNRVTNSFTAFCPGTNSPGIAVTKSCPPNPVPPGGTLVITGFVTNTGNITLTNITVTNVIAAIGQSHLILGPISLPPGGVAAFTDQYTTPLDSCGPYRDTVLASGTDKCFGRIVTASAFKDCPGSTTPKIVVIKHCPASAVPPGGIAVFSGIVSNAGNITLTNVIVVNDRPTNNTPVFGPVTLAPGQFATFTGSELVPSNCCSYFDTLLATGTSICTGSNVVSSSTAVCPTLTIPRIAVSKNCPPNPVPLGQPLVFTGSVSNAGNITLINVLVVDNKPTNNTPVLGPITLAPGESANFAGSYLVPINICDSNISDTITAVGTDVCSASNVTAVASVLCPIMPTPRLAVTKKCPPNPVAPGDLVIFTGTVSNAGNLTITNIFVVDDRPVPNTPVLGPINLIPGQSVSFSGSYIAPYDCCGPCVDTVTARGNEYCSGSNVVADASAACPRITTPRITVTRDCPLSAREGDLVFFTGSVSNSGNATLGSVSIVDSQAGVVLDNIALAPGEAVPFVGMYIPTNCGPNVNSSLVASGIDVCTGVVVSNQFIVNCSIGCPPVQTVTIFGAKVKEGSFQFSFNTDSGPTYTVQLTDLLLPLNWQPLTNFVGDGSVATIHDSVTNAHRFYRVVAQ